MLRIKLYESHVLQSAFLKNEWKLFMKNTPALTEADKAVGLNILKRGTTFMIYTDNQS